MADISVYLQTIREAEKGEAVRDAITDALSAMNLIGGNASTLDGHPASYFATANLFSALVGEVGEVDDVLEAIENGLNALKYDMGNFTLAGEGGTFTVDCTGIKGYDNLDVSKFYFELRGASGSKPSGTWTPTQSYDPATGIFTYTWGTMSADVDVKLWVVKPTKTAIGTAVTELYVNGNGTYDAGDNAAYNPVIVNVPNPIATEILRQEFTRNGHFVINPRSGHTFSEAIIDVNVDRDVKKLISQTFNQNGVYRAIDDKADGYKVVTINVAPKILIDNKRITSNGRYRAIDDGGDGYVDVQVNVPPDADLGHKTIGKNGTYNAEDDNLDGFSSVSVNVPQPVLGSKTITANGTYDPLDEDPKLDGFNSVTVNVPQTPAVLGALIVSQNGTYRASQDNYDGYDVVTVNVPQTPAVLGALIVSQNGTYRASQDNYDGYDVVTVNVEGSSSGGIKYLDNGKVAQGDPGQYITTNLDIELDKDIWYQVNVRDNGTEYIKSFLWQGSTVSIDMGGYIIITITATTAGVTKYTGNWRDMYADIISIGDLQ